MGTIDAGPAGGGRTLRETVRLVGIDDVGRKGPPDEALEIEIEARGTEGWRVARIDYGRGAGLDATVLFVRPA